ncbi:hypothetical protein [uncultured Lacinutrix sp.]|uniref:hypothetical protein n=1 Tax=uncultured Lacinutrix sp. TaxID=574032 RepID=UPI002629E059|nr:hypothetical protein [uncultured Lacinutrix sp.]
MKTSKKITPILLKSFLILSLLLSLTSCSKNDDNVLEAVTNNLPSSVLRTYTGPLSYTADGEEEIINNPATATISGSNGVYSISFSNDIPSLTGLSFERVGPINFHYEEGDNEIVINTVLVIDFTVNGNLIEFSGI